MLYCPHCDKPLTPTHVCMSRRIFLGSILGMFTTMQAKIQTNPVWTKIWLRRELGPLEFPVIGKSYRLPGFPRFNRDLVVQRIEWTSAYLGWRGRFGDIKPFDVVLKKLPTGGPR